jgi:hypothetical protein
MRQIIDGLMKPAESGPSLSSQLAMSDFDRQAQELQRQAREDSAMAGRLGTGQLPADSFRAAQQLLGERTRLSGQLAADEEKARREDRNVALNLLSQLSGQEHDTRMQRFAQDSESARMQLQHVLNLDSLDKQQAYAKDLEGFRQNYDTLRMREGFSHDQAMAQIQEQIQARLSAQGYSQEQALQAARLQVQQIEGQRNRELEERISTAKMLQDNTQFWASFGLNQQQVAAQVDQIRAGIANDAKKLGLEEQKLQAALLDANFNRSMQTAAILQELYGDNPDTMQKAADIMWGAMANAGLITQDEMRAGQLNAAAQGFRDAASFQAWANGKGYTEAEIQNIVQANSQGGNWTGGQQGGATGTPGTVEAVNSAKNYLTEIESTLRAGSDIRNIEGLIDKISTNTNLSLPKGNTQGSRVDVNTVKDLPGASSHYEIGWSNQQQYAAVKTQEGADFMSLRMLQSQGLSEQQAFKVMETVLGSDRVKRAYKAVTGKDWAG